MAVLSCKLSPSFNPAGTALPKEILSPYARDMTVNVRCQPLLHHLLRTRTVGGPLACLGRLGLPVLGFRVRDQPRNEATR